MSSIRLRMATIRCRMLVRHPSLDQRCPRAQDPTGGGRTGVGPRCREEVTGVVAVVGVPRTCGVSAGLFLDEQWSSHLEHFLRLLLWEGLDVASAAFGLLRVVRGPCPDLSGRCPPPSPTGDLGDRADSTCGSRERFAESSPPIGKEQSAGTWPTPVPQSSGPWSGVDAAEWTAGGQRGGGR